MRCFWMSHEICNADQGCQFTSFGFTGQLKDNDLRISLDGRGCWRDNIMLERLWRTLEIREHLPARLRNRERSP